MTNYCNKCEQPMARAEEATLIDGEILCLDCLPENQMTNQELAVLIARKAANGEIIIFTGMDGNHCVTPDIVSVNMNGDAIQINTKGDTEDTWGDTEDTRRNCNWCGYQLIDEQVDPDLCGACFKQYLEQQKED